MKVEDVRKLTPEERFWYWCRERYAIYLRRKAGKPKPWTDDEILQTNFFTHPYRELDKVTVWFRENIRDPLRDDPRVVFATVCFRWFNLPSPTGECLLEPRLEDSLIYKWDPQLAFSRLDRIRKRGEKVFTGAYMINSPAGRPKLEAILERVTNVWKDRKDLERSIRRAGTLREAHQRLTVYPGLGGFYAYEVVCDLRYTRMLELATDKDTWANPGPGAIRGMYRILGREIKNKSNATSPPVPEDWEEQTLRLLDLSRGKLESMPPFEMREIEHSLCEYDKYNRLLLEEGRSKRRYNGI